MSKSKSISISKPTITEIYPFKLKTYGSLKARELEWFEHQADKRISSVLPIYKLAQKISIDKQISEDEAISIVKNLDDKQHENILFIYGEDIAEIKANTYTETNFSKDIATMMIRSRVKTSVLSEIAQDLFDDYDVEFDPEQGWTAENTGELPSEIIDEICKFTVAEKDRNKPKTEGEVEEITLGK